MTWWYSQDEERWNGPCSDREEAIDLGRDEYNGESFMVMEAETGDYDMRINPSNFLETIAERNEDRSDPDGDPALYQVKTEQIKDLGEIVNKAVMRWVTKHRIDIRAWCFKKQGTPETIPELPEVVDPSAA